MRTFAWNVRNSTAGDELEKHSAELDDIPLPSFNWPFNHKAAELAKGEETSTTGLGIWDKFSEEYWQHETGEPETEPVWLPHRMLQLMAQADMVCCTRETNLNIEEAQQAIERVLDHTETVLAQVVSQHWWVLFCCLHG